jgi:hypothetical protein
VWNVEARLTLRANINRRRAGASHACLEAGLLQHFLGFFQSEFRVIGHDNRQKFSSRADEKRAYRQPSIRIRRRPLFADTRDRRSLT